MKIQVLRAKDACGTAAAEKGAEIVKHAISARGQASFVAATDQDSASLRDKKS